MERITIIEQDSTSNELTTLGSDIVYVPGFALPAAGGQEARSPKLCTSISEFEDAFGKDAPIFLVDQLYPKLDSTHSGFAAIAIPPTDSGETPLVRTWFTAGTKDPSYLYAKELIRMGIPVVYERINKGNLPDFAVEQQWLTKGVPIYSSSISYKSGDYVVQGTACYQANKDTSGTFKSSDWDAVDISSYDVTVTRMYAAMIDPPEGEDAIYRADIPGSLWEVSTYNIKYITSGGYPTFEYATTAGATISQQMATLASARGDAIAFIDHTDNPTRALTGDNSVYAKAAVDNLFTDGTDSYATLITPWGTYNTSDVSGISMPGSFGYMLALARSLRTYPSWLPVAGVVRGLIPSLRKLNTVRPLTNAIADSYQTDPGTTTANARSINAITYINDQGFVLWGNRTLSSAKSGFATTFLNMRSLICDVKKRAFTAAQKCLFEQNTDVLWINFKQDIMQLLDQMVAGSAVRYYKILKIATTDKTKLSAKIQIMPIYAVESFEISIVLTDEDLTVE